MISLFADDLSLLAARRSRVNHWTTRARTSEVVNATKGVIAKQGRQFLHLQSCQQNPSTSITDLSCSSQHRFLSRAVCSATNEIETSENATSQHRLQLVRRRKSEDLASNGSKLGFPANENSPSSHQLSWYPIPCGHRKQMRRRIRCLLGSPVMQMRRVTAMA